MIRDRKQFFSWKTYNFVKHINRTTAAIRVMQHKVMVLHVILGLLMLAQLSWTLTEFNPAKSCDHEKCKLPSCRCSDDYNPPGGLSVEDTPQIIMLTFDDDVNGINFVQYQEVFEGLRNPNGCPAVGTLFICHNYTNYMLAETLYSNSYEAADHTVTHQEPVEYFEKASFTVWKDEIAGEREILRRFGNIPYDDVIGFRAPFLMFTENMFKALYYLNFTYDLSWPADVEIKKGPMYPYTMDYLSTQKCPSPDQPCPIMSYPGLWEIPNINLMNQDGTVCGSMVDGCITSTNETVVFEFIKRNFDYHYDANRAPFGLHIHSAWFSSLEDPKGARLSALKKFFNYAKTTFGDDIWFLTGSQVIAWMRDPQNIKDAESFPPWKCPKRPEPRCGPATVNDCHYTFPRDFYMDTCTDCPPHYPSPTNPDGN